MGSDSIEKIPSWAYTFHGHKCPFMPLGFMAGQYGLDLLKLDKERDHLTYVFSEMSDENSNGCFNDGIQAATGCTFGKGLLNLLGYGKLAIVVYRADKGAVRIKVKETFLEEIFTRGKDFFALRSNGTEPSVIPAEITEKLVDDWLLKLSYDQVFEHEYLKDFHYSPLKKCKTRKKCEVCGEYVYESDLKVLNGKLICKPDYYGIEKSSAENWKNGC